MSLWIRRITSSTNNVARLLLAQHSILLPRTGRRHPVACERLCSEEARVLAGVREVCLLEEVLLGLGEGELVCRFFMAG